jgi:hypothetical protein
MRKSGLLTLEKRGRFWFYLSSPAVLAEVIAALSLLAETKP